MSIEAMKLALEALEIVTREMLTLRDELAERGGRPKSNVVHQRLWDSSFKVYTDTANTTAESLRQAIAEAEQAQQDVDWEKLYRLEVKKKEAIAAKYEQDIKPLTKIVPMAQQAEPVAWVDDYNACKCPDNEARCFSDKVFRMMQKHTNLPPRQPLTDEEIGKILERGDVAERDDEHGWWHVLPYSFARAIEAAVLEKQK